MTVEAFTGQDGGSTMNEGTVADPAVFMLADLREKFEAMASSRSFDRLYDEPEWGRMFAVLHERLNEHFTAMNGKAETTQHYGPITAETYSGWRKKPSRICTE